MLILTGPRPAAAAASMPSITLATGKSASFIARNVASSSESRLTVTRSRPAFFSAAACLARSEPLVVKVTSAESSASSATRRSQVAAHQRLAAGEAQLVHAQADEDARQARDLLEAQDRLVRQEAVVRRRTPRAACSRCSGSCSGRSPRCAGRASRDRACRRARRPRKRGAAARLRLDGNDLFQHGFLPRENP